MKTNLAISISHGFSVIGIHGTPMTGMDTVNLSSSCKHTTKLACQFKALFTVTQLHLRGAYEN